MKICKNEFDILVQPTTKCSQCALRTRTRPCLWIKLISIKVTLDCGGITKDTTSDIFKL